jgi:hypothetical protein
MEQQREIALTVSLTTDVTVVPGTIVTVTVLKQVTIRVAVLKIVVAMNIESRTIQSVEGEEVQG